MPTRTWLTTPPDRAPVTEGRPDAGAERYVPGPDVPHEPRVRGRGRRPLLVGTVVVLTVAALTAMILLGQRSRSDDPSIPDAPADQAPSPDPAEDGDQPPALPEG